MHHQLVKDEWYEKLPQHEKVPFEFAVRKVLSEISSIEAVEAFQEIIAIASKKEINLQVLSNVNNL